MRDEIRSKPDTLLDRCVASYVRAGSLDLSLDQLAKGVGSSKRMLIHYFGSREAIEEKAMARLEDRLRAQFSPEVFPVGISAKAVVAAVWERTTAPDAKGVLLLVMDISRRAWNGSNRARIFYDEQQRLWLRLLSKYVPDRPVVEELLQLLQGAILAYLITGDPVPGKRALTRMFEPRRRSRRQARRSR